MQTLQLNCVIPQGMDSAILGVSAIRNVLVTCKIPIEFTAILSDENQKEFVKASSLFKKIIVEKNYKPGEDDLILEPDRGAGQQFAEEEARARLRKMRMIDPDLPDDIGQVTTWDKYQTLEKQVITWISTLANIKIKYTPVLFTSPTIRVPKIYKDQAIQNVREEGIKGDFLVYDLNSKITWEELEEVLNYGISVIVPNGYTDMEKIGLLTHKDCVGYIGNTWLAYAAWALQTPFFIHITKDTIWDGAQTRNSILLSSNREFETRIFSHLNDLITPRVYELV